jgi:hypothetical protein
MGGKDATYFSGCFLAAGKWRNISDRRRGMGFDAGCVAHICVRKGKSCPI